MPFQTDERIAVDAGTLFGEYVTTFISSNGLVRADLFSERGRRYGSRLVPDRPRRKWRH